MKYSLIFALLFSCWQAQAQNAALNEQSLHFLQTPTNDQRSLQAQLFKVLQQNFQMNSTPAITQVNANYYKISDDQSWSLDCLKEAKGYACTIRQTSQQILTQPTVSLPFRDTQRKGALSVLLTETSYSGKFLRKYMKDSYSKLECTTDTQTSQIACGLEKLEAE